MSQEPFCAAKLVVSPKYSKYFRWILELKKLRHVGTVIKKAGSGYGYPQPRSRENDVYVFVRQKNPFLLSDAMMEYMRAVRRLSSGCSLAAS